MPDIDHFRIENEIALPELYALCKASLCDVSRILEIDVAAPLQSALPGNSADGQLFSSNLFQLLQDASLEVNCFAIYTRQSTEPWRKRYLGEAAVRRSRAALSACLLPDTTRSHPVYARVTEARQTGCTAGLRMIHVEPDTLCHFILEKLIAEMRSDGVFDWHRAARAKKR